MEVNAKHNVDVARQAMVSPAKRQPAPVVEDTTSFNRVEALEHSLQSTPVARPEAVARARELLSDVKYPPVQTINGIAALLALNLDSSAGS